MVFVDALPLNVRSMTSNAILKFLFSSFANVLNTAKGTFNKEDNITGGTSGVLANDKRLFSIAKESLSGYHVATISKESATLASTLISSFFFLFYTLVAIWLPI